MKSLIVLFSVLSIFSASAASTSLESGDIGINKAHARILSVRPLCPKIPGKMSCMAYGSVVQIEILLNGCVDRLGGTFSSFNREDNKGILYFGAVNISSEASLTARCLQANTKIVSIVVPHEGEIVLKDLDFAVFE